MNTVRLRIAPSPTGYPHIGTIYQALFNYAYAKKYNGQFLIRIEDTDKKRFVEGAEENLYKAIDWFSLTEDESPRKGGHHNPYRQSDRLGIYKKYAQELLQNGYVYYCDCSSERLEKVRKELQQEGKPPMYDKHCRELSKTSGVVRLKVPENEKILVKDEIRGEITFDSQVIDDQVLIKSDGYPTYHLASTIDDYLMEITHVVRGEEWITSFPKHALLYRYLGWNMPLFFHTPDLRNPDKSKLSKRHGHTNISWYQEQGFLSESILNYLALMGWSHPQGKEIFPLSEFIQLFELKDIKPIGPIFDIQKLEWMNGVYIRNLDSNSLRRKILNLFPLFNSLDTSFLNKSILLAQPRIKTLSEFHALIIPYIDFPQQLLTEEEKKITSLLIEQFEGLLQWNKNEILNVLKSVMESKKVRMPVFYIILTGTNKGLPLPDMLELLGREETLSRLKKRL